MKKILCLFLILITSIIVWQCASQTTPTGGPKDEIPPTLKKSNPENNQINFKGRTIELTFDELLKLNNAKEEILITPTPGKDVLITTKQNKVFIEPKNGWADSTTYSIAFREGIQDLNEGNPVEDLHLAFSTGPTIDSLQISGKVLESLTEKIPEKITVALYQSDTFDIFEHSPIFLTKTKPDGSFKLENLKKGNYFLYAFDDKNKNLKVESKNERFGFLPRSVSALSPPIKKSADTLLIMLYQIDSRPLKISSIRNTGTISQIRFNKALLSYSIVNSSGKKIHHSFAETQSEIMIYNDLKLNDSIPLSIHGTDSLSHIIDSTFYIKRIESKLPKEKFNMKITSSSFNPETFLITAKVQFNKPIGRISIDSIYITPDPVPERAPKKKATDKEKKETSKELSKDEKAVKKDTVVKKEILKIPVLIKEMSIDSVTKTLTLSKLIDKKLIPEKTKLLNLVFEQALFISLENDSSKREIKSATIANAETTGILLVEITTKYKNYEVQLLSTTGELIQKVRNVKKHTFKYLQPQEYKLMFYADINNNGKWDPENIFEKKLSEPTFFYKSPEGKYTFPIRSAWELGPLLVKF